MNKRSAVLLAIPFAIFAIACSSGSGGSGGSADNDQPAGAVAEETGKAAAAAGTVGKPVRDGKFEFTVQSVKCGVAKVGSKLLNEKAQGQFCLVKMKVRNIGKEAQIFADSSQKAYGSDGAEFSTDTAAGLYANENNDTFLNEINPGNAVTGTLVYDIPKKAKLVKLELHDSPFSGGVTVAVK